MKISFKPTMQKVQKVARTGAGKIDHGLERINDTAEYILTENPVKSFVALLSLLGIGLGLGLNTVSSAQRQNKAFKDVCFDVDKFNCLKGQELELKKFSSPMLLRGVFSGKLTEQSFLCDDGRTIVYNLPQGSKTTKIPTQFIGEKIKGVDTLEITENLDSLARKATEKAFKTMILKK